MMATHEVQSMSLPCKPDSLFLCVAFYIVCRTKVRIFLGCKPTWVESLQRQSLTSNVLSVKSVQLALKEIGKDGLQVNDEQAEDEPILSVIDAFETPRFVYNEETTKYDRSRE